MLSTAVDNVIMFICASYNKNARQLLEPSKDVARFRNRARNHSSGLILFQQNSRLTGTELKRGEVSGREVQTVYISLRLEFI